jgi:tight adherence protein B
VRVVVRSAVVTLVALLAVLIGVPASAAPAAGLSLGGLKVTDGSVSFVLTPRYASGPVDPSTVAVRAGGTSLAVQTAPATTDVAPRALILVLDTSSILTTPDLSAEQSAASTIAHGLPADVTIGLVAVTTQPIVALQPTASRSAFDAALSGLKISGRRALFDGIAAAESLLGPVGASAERRIVVIGTGVDTASTVDPAALATQLAAANIVTDGLLSTVDIPAAMQALLQATGGQAQGAAQADAFGPLATAEAGVLQPAIAVTVTVPPDLAGQTGQLDITAGGVAVSTPVTFGGTPPVAVAHNAGTTALAWVPTWLPWAFGGLFFVAVIVALAALMWPRSVKQDRIRQIGNFGPGAKAAAQKESENVPVSSVIARTALAATASVVRTGRMEERIARRLERAGMKLRAQEWVLLRTCIVIACGAALFPFAHLIGALIGAAIGYVSTMLFQTVRIDRRANQFAEQLPDALQLVIGSLRSGFSLANAFDSLVRESPDPVAAEFGRALSEHRLGADISDALERVAQRAQSEDLGWAVMAVRIQREVGGNLAEVLQTTVDTMRERGRLRRHVTSLSAEGRLSAYVLIGLPLVLGVFMFAYRRSYMEPLITDPLGIIMLSLGGLLFVLGIFWMTRVVKVEA